MLIGMATQTTEVTQVETVPDRVNVKAESLPLRSTLQSEEPQVEPRAEQAQTQAQGQPEEAAGDAKLGKPKVRRIIDEEGGTTTATVSVCAKYRASKKN